MSAESFRRDQVVSIINAVIQQVNTPQESSREMISAQLHELKAIMESLRHQLGETAAHDVGALHIPSATDELDAVTGATEEATVAIMSACEGILRNLDRADDLSRRDIEGEVTKIYEACTFQDIAGQRIAKVVKTLKTIDHKITSLLAALDKFSDEEIAPRRAEVDSGLLNGPALPQGGGMSQEEIDRLLVGF